MTTLKDEQSRQLFIEAERMRREKFDSVLWAIIRGRASPARIALLIGWPPSLVENSLKTLEADGMVEAKENGLWRLNKNHDEYYNFAAMKAMYERLEEEVVMSYPRTNIQPGYLSSPVQKKLEGFVHDTSKLVDRWVLTHRQMEYLTLIRGIEGLFSTRDYMALRGTTRAQYSKNELVALMKKGMVQVAEKQGKGDFWEITQLGQEYQHVAITEAQRKAILSGVTIGEPEVRRQRISGPRDDLMTLLLAGGMTTRELSEKRGVSRSSIHRQMTRLEQKGLIRRELLPDGSNRWYLAS